MALRYTDGQSGSKCEDNIATARADEGTAASPLPDELMTPLPDDGPAASPGPAHKSTSPPTYPATAITPVASTADTGVHGEMASSSVKTSSGTPAKSIDPRGHKSTPSTMSGSTVVARHGPKKVHADDQGRGKNHDTASPSCDGGSMDSELEREEDLPEHKEQQQQHHAPRKHHCPTADAIDEGRRIYIGNLEFTHDHNEIVALLEKVGSYKPDCCCIYVPPPSRSKNPKTKPNHRNRGYCFVTYQDSHSAATAMSKIDHIVYGGRKLVSRHCLPKGVAYTEFLERQELVQQGGALGFQVGFPSSGSSEKSSPSKRPLDHPSPGNRRPQIGRYKGKGRPKGRRAPPPPPTPPPPSQAFDPYFHYEGPYIAPVMPPPNMFVVGPHMGMPEYNPFLCHCAPPAVDPRAASLHTPVQMRGIAPEEVVVDDGSEGRNGDGVLDNNEDAIYRPPINSMQADGRTIEVLNLPAIAGTYRDFKTRMLELLNDIEVTGVSEPIYQYRPGRPSLPVIKGSGGTFTATFHNCPWFYCYIQLGSKEEAEKASNVLRGIEIKHGDSSWQCRVNKAWKLHGSD